MTHHRLRVYFGPEEDGGAAAPPAAPRETVTVPVGDILPWLADAAAKGRRWLHDFDDDEMTISRDLYEVIMTYRYYQRPTA